MTIESLMQKLQSARANIRGENAVPTVGGFWQAMDIVRQHFADEAHVQSLRISPERVQKVERIERDNRMLIEELEAQRDEWNNSAWNAAIEQAIVIARKHQENAFQVVGYTPETLGNCPEGLFVFNNTIAVKTEYKTESQSHPGKWQSDAYCVESGEYFWGGTSDPVERERLVVTPLNIFNPQKNQEHAA